MNILLDICVWKGAAMDLKNLGHNVIWVGSMAQDPGDRAIIEKAFVEKRIIVTIDKDFGELAVASFSAIKTCWNFILFLEFPSSMQLLFTMEF